MTSRDSPSERARTGKFPANGEPGAQADSRNCRIPSGVKQRTATFKITLTAGVLIALAVVFSRTRSEDAPSNSSDFQLGAVSTDGGQTITNDVIRQASRADNQSEDASTPIYYDELYRCLAAKNPSACLASTLTRFLDPEDLARLWHAIGDDWEIAKQVLKHSLEFVNPELAPFYFHTLFNKLAVLQRSVTFFQLAAEITIKDMVIAQSPWAAIFSQGLDPQTIFDESGSDALVLIAQQCVPLNGEIMDYLIGGARGEWFGTAAQQERALSVVFEELAREPERFRDFVGELLSAPTLPSNASFGAHLAAMLTFEQNIRLLSGLENARMITAILSDPRFESAAARQLFSMYNSHPPRGFSEDEWKGIWRRVETIIGPP